MLLTRRVLAMSVQQSESAVSVALKDVLRRVDAAAKRSGQARQVGDRTPPSQGIEAHASPRLACASIPTNSLATSQCSCP